MSNSNRESSSGLKPLNSEENLINRRCQLEVAEDLRAHSSKRNDVDETTDNRACEEMFAYTRSDSETLDTHKDSEVANFYKGRSVFITGASGFVGKVSSIWLHLFRDDEDFVTNSKSQHFSAYWKSYSDLAPI